MDGDVLVTPNLISFRRLCRSAIDHHRPSTDTGQCAIGMVVSLESAATGSIYDEIFVGDHPKLVNGCYALPTSPGLGIAVNEEAMKAHPPVSPRVESTADPRLG